jgi:hypothetical protein
MRFFLHGRDPNFLHQTMQPPHVSPYLSVCLSVCLSFYLPFCHTRARKKNHFFYLLSSLSLTLPHIIFAPPLVDWLVGWLVV